jgi:hypothetical protein
MKHEATQRMKKSLCIAFAWIAITPWAQAEEAAALSQAMASLNTAVTARVTAINHETREVTLQDEQGRVQRFIADDEVRNLAQVEVGDILSVDYTKRLAVALYADKSGAMGGISRTEISRAAPGQKPYGTLTKTLELSGRLAALDTKARTVTIAGKHGELTIGVDEDVDLNSVKVGDSVKMEYIESLVIAIDAPSAP